MEQSTIKMTGGGDTYYGVAIGEHAIAFDNGSVLIRENIEDENSLFTVTEDTSGSVEVTEEMQQEALIINETQAEQTRTRKLMGNVPNIDFGTAEYEYSEDEI
jgi:hypothetical protein